MMNVEEDFNLAKVKQEEEDFDCQACQDGFTSSVATENYPCQAPVQVVEIKVEEVTNYGLSQAKPAVPGGSDFVSAGVEEKEALDSSDFQDQDSDADSGFVLLLDGQQPTQDKNSIAVEHWRPQMAWKRPHQCEYCGSKFSQRGHLNEHMRTHTGERPYVCCECNQAFARADTLTAHSRIHSGIKPHTCPSCGDRFSRRDSLARHMRYHVGAKPFRCEVCDMRYTEGSTLRRHMRKHTGERPYVCPFCSKSFAINHSLKRHMHSHTGSKDYSCGICGAKFARRYLVTKHTKKLHPVQDTAETQAPAEPTTLHHTDVDEGLVEVVT